MKKIFFTLILVLALTAPAVGQVVVSGVLRDISGNVVTSNAEVDFELQNYRAQIPRVSGTSTIVQVKKVFKPDNTGAIHCTGSGCTDTLYQNANITPAGTFYSVCVVNKGETLRCNNYLINGAFDLNSAIALNSAPPIGPSQTILQCFPFVQVSPATTWTITHNENDLNVLVQATDLSGIVLALPVGGVNISDSNVTVITWGAPQAGRALVCHAGPVNIATSQANVVLLNPPAPQTVSNGFTLTGSFASCNLNKQIYVNSGGCYTTIQSAVNAAGAGDVYIPAGTYALISGVTFSSALKLHGAGKERTIVQVPASVTGFANANQASALSFGEISDMTIQLQGNNSIGIDQKALTRWDINRVRFNHTAGTTGEIAIKFHGGNTVSSFSTNVTQCEFNVAAGIGALIVDAANDQRIGPGNTFIVNNSSVGVKIDGTIDSTGSSVPNTTRINGNRFDTTVAGDVAISLSPTLATNDTWIAYNRFESASTSTSVIIGCTADSTRLGPNWYTGGTFWTDCGIRTYIMEPRPFGLPINSTFDFKWRQNFLIDPADDAETYLRIASGATAAQHARLYFKDNISAADVWTLDKDASNNWLLYDPVNLHTHIIAIPNGATKLNAFGSNKIVFNGNANSSTLGVDFQSGGASPTSVAHIDGTGKFTSDVPTGTAPFVIASTTSVANLGIQNCNNCVVQHRRVSGCATAASLNATCDTTVTWLNSFADANYTALCNGDGVTSGVPVLAGHSISAAKTAGAIAVRTLAVTAAAAQFTTLDCMSWHD